MTENSESSPDIGENSEKSKTEVSSIVLEQQVLLPDNSSKLEILNFTGIQDVTTEDLQTIYSGDSEKFYKSVRSMARRFSSKLKQYDPEQMQQDTLSRRLVLCYKGEVMQIIDKVACYQRFLENLGGLVDDTEDEKILELETEVSALKGLYIIILAKYDTLVEAMNLNTSQGSQKSSADDSQTKKEESSQNGSGSVEEKNGDENADPDNTDENEDKETTENDEDVEKNEEDNRENQSSERHQRKENLQRTTLNFPDGRQSIPENRNQASTPLRENHVRFSEVVGGYTLSDYSLDPNQQSGTRYDCEDSWKFVTPKTNKIEEISMVEDLQEISRIISHKISPGLSDVEILSMDKRDRAALKELKVNIEKKSSKLPDNCDANLKTEAVKGFKAASKWLSDLNNLLIDRGLHLESERRHAKPLELEKFCGHTDTKTNVYEFFKLYNIVSRGFTKEDKAYYLYANYLSEDMKKEVRHIRNDFFQMKELLIRRHGNINILLMHKRNQIKKLKSIHFKSNRSEKIKFVKSFCEIVDQIGSMVELNVKDYPNMQAEVFSYNNVIEIAKLLPEFIFSGFSREYVRESSKRSEECLSGEESFNVLMKHLKQTLKDLEFTQELYLDESVDKDVKPKSKQKPIYSFESGNQISDESTGKLNTDKYYGAPCIAHKKTKKRVRDCLSGKCRDFLQMKPLERNKMAEEKNVCKLCLLYRCKKEQTNNQCLLKGVLPPEIACNRCEKARVHCNVLLCSDHKNDSEDIKNAIGKFLPGFSKGTAIELMLVGKIMKVNADPMILPMRVNENAFDIKQGKCVPKSDVAFKTKPNSPNQAVYPMQIINLGGIHVQVLFDTGAMGECMKADIAEKLKLTVLDPRPQSFTVAGGDVMMTKCPLYEITLGPNDRDEYQTFPLLGMEKISDTVPKTDLSELVKKARKELVSFPESKAVYPQSIGGQEIELIIGIRQAHLFPTREYVFPDGLQVWRSPLQDVFGSNMIFAGTYDVVQNAYNFINQIPTFFKEECRLYKITDCLAAIDSLVVRKDNPFASKHQEVVVPEEKIPENLVCEMLEDLSNKANETVTLKTSGPKAAEKLFEEQEQAGCTVDYRCPDCQDCKQCKESNKVRAVSIKEEAEEALIAKSVDVDLDKKISSCVYPFIKDPDVYLSNKWNGKKTNFDMAVATLKSQQRKSPEIRKSVVAFNKELYEKKFVAPLGEFPADIQKKISEAKFVHYFCWRTVFKPDSVSTPARIVIDPTVSSFNDVIAKGNNCLTSLYQLIINWRSNIFAFTSDISKMYNSVQLKPEMYRYSLYLFSESLDPSEDIQIWVNKTLMYGLKSAANQATHALRETATLMKEEYPLAHEVIHEKTYMDDSSGGSNDQDECEEIIQQVKSLLPNGGFKLKVVTKSGEIPDEKASSDGITTSFAGYKWLPKEDLLMFKCGDINFNAKRRGIKKPNKFPIITEEDVTELVKNVRFTRRNLLGKTLELFDIIGLWEPIKVRFKIDLQKLTGLDYDVTIPEEQRSRWVENLKLMHLCRELECSRAIVPSEAKDPNKMELIVCSDAATTMCGCVIYARFELKDGSFSSQLLTSRSRTSLGTIPRNELEGCLLAAETAYTVCKALGNRVTNLLFVSDSTICICWISNPNSKLKQFVHTRVKKIHRLIGSNKFLHIPGDKNPADMVTRGNVTLDDVSKDSKWQKGFDWMKLAYEDMPLKSYEDLCSSITPDDLQQVEKEIHPTIPAVHMIGDQSDVNSCLFQEDTNSFCSECSCKISENEKPLKSCELFKVSPSSKSEETMKSEAGSSEKSMYLVDFIRFGFKRAFTQLAFVFRFIIRLKHKVHVRKGLNVSDDCSLCKIRSKFSTSGLEKIDPTQLEENNTSICSPLDFYLAWKFICKIGSQEFKANVTSRSKLKEYEEEEGILFGGGRLSYPELRVETEVPIYNLDYRQPVFDASSVVVYALIMYVHWELCPHSGVERTMNHVLKIVHVPRIRKLVKYIRETCPRCRFLLKKHYLPLTGNQSIYSLMIAPPFFSCMIDIAGTFTAYDSIRKRISKNAYFLVQVCLITGAVSIGVLEDLSVGSIVQSLSRSAARYGWSKYLVLDNQTSFKALGDARISFSDLKGKLWTDQKLILDFSTPYAHNEHGRVESKIKVLKQFLEKSGDLGRRHSFIEWETIAVNVASVINGLPICHNQDDRGDSQNELGLISPNMFLIGRNNNRAPERFVSFESNPARAIKQLSETNNKLLELLGDFVHRFIPGRKFSECSPPSVDDIVLFISKEAQRSRNVAYKYGRVVETHVDGRANKVKVSYRNSDEVLMRTADRNIKDLVLILGSDEIDFNTHEHQLASRIQQKYL